MNIRSIFVAGMLFFFFGANGQTEKKTDFVSYIKSIQQYNLANDSTLLLDQLFHQRTDFKYYLSDNVTFALSERTRLFMGESIKLSQPFMAEMMKDDAGLMDLSFVLSDGANHVLHTYIDRLWLEWVKGEWEFRLGRQRVNWGINMLWNTNDLFNAYSFLDWDYEERPGVDAFRLMKYINGVNSFELVIAPGADNQSHIGAARFVWNKWNYDFQFLGGYAYEDVVLGTGWAGSVKNMGFKGEITYYYPTAETSKEAVAVSSSLDYQLKNGIYLNAGFLYSSLGKKDLTEGLFLGTQAGVGGLSSKLLMPMEWTWSVMGSYGLNVASNISLTLLYSPSGDLVLFVPTFAYTISEAWEINFVTQAVSMDDISGNGRSFGAGFFLRTKFNF